MSKKKESCAYCDKPIKSNRGAIFLEAQIVPFSAVLRNLRQKDSQGWFYWHRTCAEKSIKQAKEKQ